MWLSFEMAGAEIFAIRQIPDVYSALELMQGDAARLFSARQLYGIPLVVRSIKISGDAQQYFPRDSSRI